MSVICSFSYHLSLLSLLQAAATTLLYQYHLPYKELRAVI